MHNDCSFWRLYKGARAAECAFCSSLIYGIGLIGQNAKIPLRVILWCTTAACLGVCTKAQGEEWGSKTFCLLLSRSDTYKVSMQQTTCSAISRGFEPRSAPESMCTRAATKKRLLRRCASRNDGAAQRRARNDVCACLFQRNHCVYPFSAFKRILVSQ